MPRQPEDPLIQRLDLILRLLAMIVASERSVTEGARALKVAGLDNKTIAQVLHTTDATVRTLTSNMHKPISSPKSKRK